MAEQEELRVSVSVARKLNLGQYESADIFIAVSGVEPGASDAEIEEALVTGDRAIAVLKKHLRAQIAEARKEWQNA
jgi:hypothetical protein